MSDKTELNLEAVKAPVQVYSHGESQYYQQPVTLHQPSYPYRRVHVLLFCWEEDDTASLNCLLELKFVLETTFRFTVIHSLIPSEDHDDHVQELLNSLREALSDPENLIIVYYGGHAYLRRNSGLVLVPYK
jgi:hypothetical protein